MTDNTNRGLAGPAGVHFQIVPSDTVNFESAPRALYFHTAGTAVVVDSAGTALSYTKLAGEVLPFSGIRVNATGTTATLYGWV